MRRVRIAAFVAIFLALSAIVIFINIPHSVYSGWTFSSDTAIATEAHFIRHKSMSDLVEVFGLGPGLLPYFASDYVWAPPPYLNAHEELQ